MNNFQIEKEALMKVLVDSAPPLNGPLSAKYIKSFAYPSMKDRLPVIITKVIDYLVRDKKGIIDCYGEEAREELKQVIGEISELKNHIQTSKDFRPFTSEDPDTNIWNCHLQQRSLNLEANNYYEADWLFAECYLFRRLREIFATKKNLKSLDPFSMQKQEALCQSIPIIEPLMLHLDQKRFLDKSTALPMNDLRCELIRLLKWSLWANRMDLNLNPDSYQGQNAMIIENFEEFLLIDDSHSLASSLLTPDTNSKVIDIIMDNSGLEMLCDLVLADFLVARCGVNQVNFHVKSIPWYVSDVMARDFNQGVESIASSTMPHVAEMGQRWQKYIQTGKWNISAELYWCLGIPYQAMPSSDPTLYSNLQKSNLIIFKGDLNYRKLVQDFNWEPTTSFAKVLEPFKPAPILAVRTLKADTICGLQQGIADRLNAFCGNEWLVSGKYGIIQFCYPKERD